MEERTKARAHSHRTWAGNRPLLQLPTAGWPHGSDPSFAAGRIRLSEIGAIQFQVARLSTVGGDTALKVKAKTLTATMPSIGPLIPTLSTRSKKKSKTSVTPFLARNLLPIKSPKISLPKEWFIFGQKLSPKPSKMSRKMDKSGRFESKSGYGNWMTSHPVPCAAVVVTAAVIVENFTKKNAIV